MKGWMSSKLMNDWISAKLIKGWISDKLMNDLISAKLITITSVLN